MNSLKAKVKKYNEILQNTINYRRAWNESLKQLIVDTLNETIDAVNLKAVVDIKDQVNNLEVVALSMGHNASGLAEKIPGSDSKREFLKSNGALIYQQMFNGKVMIMIMYPYIENYGEPRPPKTLEILRPEEFKKQYIIKHVEALFKELIEWEDYDDDLPENIPMAQIGFNVPPIEDEEEEKDD